jgi:hypothetical protein
VTTEPERTRKVPVMGAIPYVLDAPPGVVIAPVFGAYQWPGATS